MRESSISPKIAFFGSPRLASECLETMLKHFNVKMIVSQPDRKYGRGGKIKPTEVSEAAVRHGVPLYRPVRFDDTVIQALGHHGVELIVVVAYGLILPREVIKLPKYGCLNLHASLLPKYRGPSPVESAILNGETKTGITVQVMKYEMDTGDILSAREIDIARHWNSTDLMEKIISLAPDFLVVTVEEYLSGTLKAVRQIEDEATYCVMINKRDGLIDWRESAEKIERKVKAYYSWPVAFTYLDRKLLKIYTASVYSSEYEQHGKPGEVLDVLNNKGIIVQTGRGILAVRELQLESKKRMKHEEFFRGSRHLIGNVLCSEAGNRQ
jgi:methionyl-tRNA formyltransferase